MQLDATIWAVENVVKEITNEWNSREIIGEYDTYAEEEKFVQDFGAAAWKKKTTWNTEA
jgi:hypothetical protein